MKGACNFEKFLVKFGVLLFIYFSVRDECASGLADNDVTDKADPIKRKTEETHVGISPSISHRYNLKTIVSMVDGSLIRKTRISSSSSSYGIGSHPSHARSFNASRLLKSTQINGAFGRASAFMTPKPSISLFVTDTTLTQGAETPNMKPRATGILPRITSLSVLATESSGNSNRTSRLSKSSVRPTGSPTCLHQVSKLTKTSIKPYQSYTSPVLSSKLTTASNWTTKQSIRSNRTFEPSTTSPLASSSSALPQPFKNITALPTTTSKSSVSSTISIPTLNSFASNTPTITSVTMSLKSVTSRLLLPDAMNKSATIYSQVHTIDSTLSSRSIVTISPSLTVLNASHIHGESRISSSSASIVNADRAAKTVGLNVTQSDIKLSSLISSFSMVARTFLQSTTGFVHANRTDKTMIANYSSARPIRTTVYPSEMTSSRTVNASYVLSSSPANKTRITRVTSDFLQSKAKPSVAYTSTRPDRTMYYSVSKTPIISHRTPEASASLARNQSIHQTINSSRITVTRARINRTPVSIAVNASRSSKRSLRVETRMIASFQSAIKMEFRVDFRGLKLADKLQIVVQKYHASFTGVQNKAHSWYEVHYFEDYKYHDYITEEFTEPKQVRRLKFNFTIGNDKRCKKKQFATGYCNGPLEQGRYRFRLFYHVRGTVTKSKYSKIYSTAPEKATPPFQTTGIDQNKVTVAVIAVLAVLLVIIIIVAVVLYRKKNSRRDPSNDSDDPDCTLLSSLKRNSSSCYGRKVLGVGDSVLSLKHVSKGMSRPVHVKDFIAWVTRSQADSDFRFAEEFESMRDVGRDQTHEASDLPENRGKNRYTNVLAYDKTRVKLSYYDDEVGSDYINANYIHGYKHPRAYIAAQGPLPGTTDDFWRMIWEQNAHTIVMVTQCMERSRVKCHEYWPGTQATAFGEITVSLLSEFSYPDWIEREFLLEGEGEGSRKVKHLQYSAWPDHGVPRTTTNILDFLQAIRANVKPTHGPMVIHCSAGVGRTGTLIAIDTLINRLQEENVIDVYLTVCLMRMQRCSMVQTEDQYIFIHRAIVDYLKSQSENPESQLKGYYLLPTDEPKDKTTFDHLAPRSHSPSVNRDSGLALLLGEFETEHAKEAEETVA
eukprot:gene12834-14154_t